MPRRSFERTVTTDSVGRHSKTGTKRGASETDLQLPPQQRKKASGSVYPRPLPQIQCGLKITASLDELTMHSAFSSPLTALSTWQLTAHSPNLPAPSTKHPAHSTQHPTFSIQLTRRNVQVSSGCKRRGRVDWCCISCISCTCARFCTISLRSIRWGDTARQEQSAAPAKEGRRRGSRGAQRQSAQRAEDAGKA